MNIIFHYPLPLNPSAKSASGIRPIKMLSAFRDLGYQVDIVSGYSQERKFAIESIKNKVRSGFKYEFVYSESSTMPTILTDPHHLPLHPCLDFGFFRFCVSHQIPIGLFYRDIYWLFEGYGEKLNPLKVIAAKIGYWYDLFIYRRYLTRLFLPSIEMGRYIPLISPDNFTALPPAHGVTEAICERNFSNPLRLFYVGGMSDHYQIHKLFSAVSHRSDVELTVCTRETEWDAVKSEYLPLPENIDIVHKSGEAMEELLDAAHVVVLFVKPQEYWEFAAPVKLYEYLGHIKPIIASEGTLAGKFVSENYLGWTVQYSEKKLHALLDRLINKPEVLDEIRIQMESVAKLHTWKARALQVAQELTQ